MNGLLCYCRAGFEPELAGELTERAAEAGFAGWVACMQGDAQLRYSAWLDLLPRLLASVNASDRKALSAAIAEGPRADYRAIDERLARVRPLVRDVAWQGYDQFLHANRVAEGVRSYDGVVGLVAAARFDDRWRPRTTSANRGGR